MQHIYENANATVLYNISVTITVLQDIYIIRTINSRTRYKHFFWVLISSSHAVPQARDANVPMANIERALKRGQDTGSADYKESVFEAYGKGGAGIIITVLSDNANRASSDVKCVPITRCPVGKTRVMLQIVSKKA